MVHHRTSMARHRKLRIAWSVGWGIVAVLVCMLWVRSYKRTDILSGPLIGPRSFQAIACSGKLAVIIAPYSADWHHEAWMPEQSSWRRWQFSLFRFYNSVPRTANRHEWAVSFGLLITVAAAIGAASWSSYRFSLRTLLIATTLVAVVLGLIVWAVRG